MAATLRQARAAIEVSDADQLGRTVRALLSDPERRRRLAQRGGGGRGAGRRVDRPDPRACGRETTVRAGKRAT